MIAGGITAVSLIVFAKLLALVSLAANETALWSFVVILAVITLMAASLATMAMHRLVEPLRGTWLEGIEWLVIFSVSGFAAIAISLTLLKS